MLITWWHMAIFIKDATSVPPVPEHLTNLPVARNTTGVTLTLYSVFPSMTSKKGWRSLSFSVESATLTKANNPRMLHMNEFISSFLKWHLTEQIPPEIKQMWWVGKGSCRGGSPGKSYWDQEAVIKALKYLTLGELLGDHEKKGQNTNFCHFPIFTLTSLFAAHVMISCDKCKCLLRNYDS